jgi:hypothetical protein
MPCCRLVDERNRALFRKGNDWAAYSGSGERARTTVVQVGHRNAQAAEALSGLSINDRVALLPSNRIKEGFSYQPAKRLTRLIE